MRFKSICFLLRCLRVRLSMLCVLKKARFTESTIHSVRLVLLSLILWAVLIFLWKLNITPTHSFIFLFTICWWNSTFFNSKIPLSPPHQTKTFSKYVQPSVPGRRLKIQEASVLRTKSVDNQCVENTAEAVTMWI